MVLAASKCRPMRISDEQLSFDSFPPNVLSLEFLLPSEKKESNTQCRRRTYPSNITRFYGNTSFGRRSRIVREEQMDEGHSA